MKKAMTLREASSGEVRLLDLRFLSSYDNIIYSHRMMFLYHFMTCIKGHFMLKKDLNFDRLQNLKKIVRPRVKIFPQLALVPKLALPPTATSPNWHFTQLALPQLALPPTGTILNFFVPMRI